MKKNFKKSELKEVSIVYKLNPMFQIWHGHRHLLKEISFHDTIAVLMSNESQQELVLL